MIRLAYKNLASDPDIRQWVEDHVGPQLHRTRVDRLQEEERWLHFWKIWNVELDDQSYNGRSRVYLSAGRNVLETWKIALKQGLFPASTWHGVEAKHAEGLEGDARAEQALQKVMLDHMKLRGEMDPFLQQYLTYGTAVLRHSWEDEEETQRFWKRVPEGYKPDKDTTLIRLENEADQDDADEQTFRTTAGTRIALVEESVKKKYGPTCRTVDLFHFYVSPTTARSVDDADFVFEDITTRITRLEDLAEQYMDEKHPELGTVYEEIGELVRTDGGRLVEPEGAGGIPLEIQQADFERRLREGMEQDPNRLFLDLGEGFVNVSECAWRGEIPGAADPETGREYGMIDWKLVLVNDRWCVHASPNPLYRKRRPWHVARLIRVVNEFYGRGLVEPFASIQYFLNDLGNLTMDGVVNSLNPVVLIDSTRVSNFDTLQLAPNAKWFFEGPPGESVQFVTPPNVAAIGSATMNMMMGFIQDYGQANFAVQGTPAPRGRGRSQNTASGMAQMQSAGSAGFAAAMEDLQEQLFVPVLQTNYEFQEQFMSDRMLITLGGADGVPLLTKPIGFEDVIGEYVFTWKGANAVRERQGLVQGLQGLTQLLAQVRASDPDAASQFKIKWGALAKRFLTDGLGLSWADEVIETPDDHATIDPRLENDLMAARRSVEVSPTDDDAAHLAVVAEAEHQSRFMNDVIAGSLLQAHKQAHEAQAASKQEAQMAQMMQQMMAQQQAAGGQGGPPGMGSLPAPAPANPGDLAQAAGAAASAAGQGQITGPLGGGPGVLG